MGVLVIGIAVVVASVVLGLVGAEQFRAILQHGDTQGHTCVPLAGYPAPASAAPLAQMAVWLSVAGPVPATGTLLLDRRPLPMLCAITLAASCVIAIWLNWSVVHGIATCEPYTHYFQYGDWG